eukprot:CAMPEP_0113458840 /NCGR_PEP_ID=MMETSP0014_2-20120614/10131_1 /TAXON_ID=2857 /ORGANISM="Nitzschia sp." /LENGTH=721 /DNA_ID=CAMNT_0000350379 /DNA_START=852 /DNA_END=3017 /DNA_ORIENTATION=- /assembly_acc=CAM_ASM_000159
MMIRPTRTKKNTTTTTTATRKDHPKIDSDSHINNNGLALFWRGLADHVQHHPHLHNHVTNHSNTNIHQKCHRKSVVIVAAAAAAGAAENKVSRDNDDDDIIKIKSSPSSSSSSSASSLSKTTMISEDNHDDGDEHHHHHHHSYPHPQHDDDHNERQNLPLPLPLFEPAELTVGELLGKGSFCHVYELDDLNLSTTTTTTTKNNSDDTGGCLLPNRSRRRFYNSVHNGFSNSSRSITKSSSEQQQQPRGRTSRYVVKRLRPNLRAERGRKIFCHAAVDIREEFELLSLIDHPNIVKVCGGYRDKASGLNHHHHNNINNKNGDSFLSLLASRNRSKTPSSASALALEDPFFMILERLDKTLTQQIQEWKKAQKGESSASSITTTTTTITTTSIDGVVDKEKNTRLALYSTKLRYAYDVANALAWMHSHRLIYRDLKPDNVGIATDGTVKIFDFGLARSLPPVEKAVKSYHHNGRRELMFRMSGVGTRRYMSPECIVGHIYNQSVDCYSWAMVFYEMLSLQKPFASYNREVHRVVVCEHQERPCLVSTDENIPRDAQLLLHRAWGQDPSNRPTMDELCKTHLRPMIDRAERLSLTPAQRSSAAIMEMSQLLGGLGDFSVSKSSPPSSTSTSWLSPWKSLCSSNSGDNRSKRHPHHHSRQQHMSRKSSSSTADMTVSTAALTTASSSDFCYNDSNTFKFVSSLGAPAGILAVPGGMSSCWSAADI